MTAPADRLYDKLNSAVDKLLNQEISAGAISSALPKQGVVALLSRSALMARFASIVGKSPMAVLCEPQ